MQRIHQVEDDREELLLDLDEIARQGARKMLACALEAEVADYIETTRDQRDENGHALVVRNGRAREREILLGAGTVEVRAPRINDRRVDEDGNRQNRQRFKSVILPPYMRRSPKVTEVLPLLYLHGLSSGDFVPALEQFFGTEAGLSASTITRPSEQWQQEREHFMSRDLSERDYVYIWVDGIHTSVRLGGDDRLCCLVIVGARLDGTKELVAIEDGYRESTESWAGLLRDLKKRGMRAPELAVGDGSLGFWGAVRDVFPKTRHQRDWVHKTKNVLDSMPKSVHSRAKKAIHEITEAENKKEAEGAIKEFAKEFAKEFGTKWPKAVEKIVSEKELLLAYYDYPAEHWIHLRTTNPIESTFAPVRARTDITKGPGQGAGITSGGFGDDIQADRGCPGEVEEAKWTSFGSAGQSRSEVRERGVGSRKRREGRRVTGEFNPQLLTIPLLVDARYEKARVDGRVVSQGVLVVSGVRDDSFREILAVEVADTESEATYQELFRSLKAWDLRGVELVVSDDHEGLKAAIARHFQGATHQRCQVHYSRNLLGRVGHARRKELAEGLRGVFAAPNREVALGLASELADRWREGHPRVAEHV